MGILLIALAMASCQPKICPAYAKNNVEQSNKI